MDTGKEVYVQMTYGQVFPPGVERESTSPFSVEIVCPKQFSDSYELSDAEPRLVVGAVIGSEGHYTVLAENVFKLDGVENASAKFHAEREGMWELLKNNVSQTEKKRSALELITPTASKKKVRLDALSPPFS